MASGMVECVIVSSTRTRALGSGGRVITPQKCSTTNMSSLNLNLNVYNGLRMTQIVKTRGGLSLPLAFNELKNNNNKKAWATTRAFKPLRRPIVSEAHDTALDAPAVTDATWKSLVLESDLPVLVEFWAPWCGPCRVIHPVIDELSRQYAGKLKCYKLNTDQSPSIATEHGIRSIPTIMIFKNGEKKDAIIGAVPKSTLTACIDKFI